MIYTSDLPDRGPILCHPPAVRVLEAWSSMQRILFLIPALLCACASPRTRRHGDAAGASILTVERIVSDSQLEPEGLPALRWLDGGRYTTLAGHSEIVAWDAATGAREVLVAAAELTPSGASEPLGVESYSWSNDHGKLLVFTNSRRVWRQNTRGDYWVLDRASGRLHQLGGDAEEARLMFAKFSPDGSRVAYVYANNLRVEDLESGAIHALTQDGSATVINGTFDWVYEEEFFLRDGFRWSPDGSSIAYWQLDSSGVGEFLLIDNTSGIYSKVVPVQYPKAGTTNSAGRIGVVPAAGGDTVWMQTPGDPRNTYLARMEWAATSDALAIQHLTREQNHLQVLLADARTGSTQCVLEEHDAAWLETCDDWKWLDEGARFLWTSERDGWRHAWIAPRNGGEAVLVTPGDYDAIAIEHVDVARGWLYCSASPDDPTRRYLYRVPLAGGAPERITPVDQPGTHTYDVSPDGAWAVHGFSTFGEPESFDMVALPDHRVARVLLDNARARAARAALTRGKHAFFRVDTGQGVWLDGWMMLPPHFDPRRSWPVLFHVYGEPWGQTVQDSGMVDNHLWHVLLTQLGYVVMSIDNRGTPAPRGRHWRKCVYGAIGVLASADQAAAVRAIQARHPWVDPERIGIWGWSG